MNGKAYVEAALGQYFPDAALFGVALLGAFILGRYTAGGLQNVSLTTPAGLALTANFRENSPNQPQNAQLSAPSSNSGYWMYHSPVPFNPFEMAQLAGNHPTSNVVSANTEEEAASSEEPQDQAE